MVLEEFVWKTRPGACEVEPPVAGSGPWSTTVTSVQPRAESSSASAAPTTPAPMITTRAPLMSLPWDRSGRTCRASRAWLHERHSRRFVRACRSSNPAASSVPELPAASRHVGLQFLADRLVEGWGLVVRQLLLRDIGRAGRRVLRAVAHPPVVVVRAVDERAVEAGA